MQVIVSSAVRYMLLSLNRRLTSRGDFFNRDGFSYCLFSGRAAVQHRWPRPGRQQHIVIWRVNIL